MAKLWLFRLSFPLVGRFPSAFYVLTWLAGWLIWWVFPKLRQQVNSNLSPIYGPNLQKKSGVGPEVVRNIARYYVDLAAMPYRDFKKFNRTSVTFSKNSSLYFNQLMQEKSVIIMSGHIGNPEIALTALHAAGREWLEIVEPLSKPLDQFLSQVRSYTGAHVETNGMKGARAALKQLRKGGIVALIADRNMSEKGVCVSVFDRHILFPSGPWQLARASRATVFPIFCIRGSKGSTKIFVNEPLQISYTDNEKDDIQKAAQQWATIWASHLKTHPTQWSILENFWENHRCG